MTLLVLLLENLLFPFAALLVLGKFLVSPRRRLLLSLGEELAERLGFLSSEQVRRLSGREVLWIHAASAGEVTAAQGLLEALRRLPKAPAVVFTCSTRAGREKATSLRPDLAVLAPLDCFPAVSRFIRSSHPSTLLVVETELWPHMIELAFRRGVRLGLVNGRLSEEAFRRYRPFASLARPFLRRFRSLAVQSQADRERFLALGADPGSLKVTGNMKYDRLSSPDPAQARQVLESLGWQGALFVAGSTHPVEEEILARAYLEARKRHPGLKLVLAPRHVERSAQAAESLKRMGLRLAPWSSPSPGADCLLVDRLGVLPQLYALASLSFVGGTLVPVGGHNLLEPAIAGSPVLFGPHTSHTEETARLLEEAGCGFRVSGASDLSRLLKELLSDPGLSGLGELARRTAEGFKGATQRTLDHLAGVLGP